MDQGIIDLDDVSNPGNTLPKNAVLPDLPPLSKKAKTDKASNCWDHFNKFVDETGNRQSQLVSNTSSGRVLSYSFSQENARKALTERVILDELAFRFVEGVGFRKFCDVLQPRFENPSRITVARDVMKLHLEEKQILKSMLKGRRVNLTTDTWTSIQNMNYMCLTAHFIDDKWVLRKRILGFCMVEDHKGDTVGRKVDSILRDWGIDAILTLTVDNASSNNLAIKYLRTVRKDKKETILNHEFLHVRCSAHILNLIVKEGLTDLENSIKRIRDVVRYVRSSPSRFISFRKCVDLCKIESKSLLCLDITTCWNSTYKMLEGAEKFEKAFNRMLMEDKKFSDYFFENERSTPSEIDWNNSRGFVELLKMFYDATKRFSGPLFVTSNLYFDEIFLIFSKINELCDSEDLLLNSMALKMKSKFEKYWGGDAASMNLLLYVSVVLDPRKKMAYLEFWFTEMYGEMKAGTLITKVQDTLDRLFKCYSSIANECGAGIVGSDCETSVPISSTSVNATDPYKDLENKFKTYMVGKQISLKNELQKYLGEDIDREIEGFDVLKWWKANNDRFRVLSKMASDVMAVPLSTVASESAFSTGGRVLDPFRSSLSPNTVEALVCTQNWLRDTMPISLRDFMDEVEEMEG